MNQFDAESFLDDLITQAKPLLAAQVDLINAEKNPSLPTVTDFLVPKISDSAWVRMSMDEKVKSFSDFAFVYIDSIDAIPNGHSLGMNYKFDLVLILSNRHDKFVDRLVLRYQRALIQTGQKLWSYFTSKGVDYSFESLTPIDVKLQNSAHFQKCLGIRISITFN